MKRESRRVGVRELRQNLSVHLRRVRAGETLEVTERGEPVALLVPTPGSATALGRLISSGRAAAPAGDLLELGPPLRHSGKPLSTLLDALRHDRL